LMSLLQVSQNKAPAQPLFPVLVTSGPQATGLIYVPEYTPLLHFASFLHPLRIVSSQSSMPNFC
jgi:hypothetical protein